MQSIKCFWRLIAWLNATTQKSEKHIKGLMENSAGINGRSDPLTSNWVWYFSGSASRERMQSFRWWMLIPRSMSRLQQTAELALIRKLRSSSSSRFPNITKNKDLLRYNYGVTEKHIEHTHYIFIEKKQLEHLHHNKDTLDNIYHCIFYLPPFPQQLQQQQKSHKNKLVQAL